MCWGPSSLGIGIPLVYRLLQKTCPVFAVLETVQKIDMKSPLSIFTQSRIFQRQFTRKLLLIAKIDTGLPILIFCTLSKIVKNGNVYQYTRILHEHQTKMYNSGFKIHIEHGNALCKRIKNMFQFQYRYPFPLLPTCIVLFALTS